MNVMKISASACISGSHSDGCVSHVESLGKQSRIGKFSRMSAAPHTDGSGGEIGTEDWQAKW